RPFSDAALAHVQRMFEELERQARADAEAEAVAADAIELGRSLDVRYLGADAALSISQPADGDYAAAFTFEHRRLYGYAHENRPLEIVAARVEAVGRSATRLPESHAMDSASCPPHGTHAMHFDGELQSAALYHRDRLNAGARITGPAIVVEPLTTTIIDPGWK